MRQRPPSGIVLTLAAVLVLTLTACGSSSSEGEEVGAALSPAPSSEAPEPRRTKKPRTTASPTTPPPVPSPSITVPDLKIPPRFAGPVLGGDISWPQCPEGMGIPEKRTLGMPMPLPEAKYVVIGLTNGPAFTPNPCLADQVRWVAERELMASAYAVNSYPDDRTLQRYRDKGPYDGSTRLGALRNVGYQQALYNIANLRQAGLRTPIIWLDVEPVPVFEWSGDTVANGAVVEGAARGYTDQGFQIGAYSTTYLWQTVVGDLRLGIPEWRAAGQTSREEALSRCGPDSSFQGGEGVIAQWVEASRDQNITCPGTEVEMFRWFHQY